MHHTILCSHIHIRVWHNDANKNSSYAYAGTQAGTCKSSQSVKLPPILPVIINSMDKMKCTSLLHLLNDNGWTRQRQEGARCPVQQMICRHTGAPIELLGRPVNSQTTVYNRGRPTMKCQLGWKFFKLNYQQGKQLLQLHACCCQCRHIPISKIDNGDTRTRICFDNRLSFIIV